MTHPYPCTVTPARYGGTYEGAPWLAFACHPADVPEMAFGDDVTAGAFWDIQSDLAEGRPCGICGGAGHLYPVGRGNSPDEAVADLVARLAPPAASP